MGFRVQLRIRVILRPFNQKPSQEKLDKLSEQLDLCLPGILSLKSQRQAGPRVEDGIGSVVASQDDES